MITDSDPNLGICTRLTLYKTLLCLHRFCAQQITLQATRKETEQMRCPMGSSQGSPDLVYFLGIKIQGVLYPVNFTDFSVMENLCLQTTELLDRCTNTKLYFCIQLGNIYYISVNTLEKSQRKIQPLTVSDVCSNNVHICADFSQNTP